MTCLPLTPAFSSEQSGVCQNHAKRQQVIPSEERICFAAQTLLILAVFDPEVPKKRSAGTALLFPPKASEAYA